MILEWVKMIMIVYDNNNIDDSDDNDDDADDEEEEAGDDDGCDDEDIIVKWNLASITKKTTGSKQYKGDISRSQGISRHGTNTVHSCTGKNE